ncbi:MAG: hypothetical protein P8Y80_13620 [Acidobacteriota bacterium]|jgi:hypothetical protein
MVIKRIRPTTFQVTIHAYELSALVAAARTIVHGDKDASKTLSEDARLQLESVLADYDQALQRIED